ncbi:MAG: metallophosphoesterase family protein [Muribaculaceae bacterium]|nr:metallophosphoesterase family protein [Muribaculaceae bacterium]
MKRIFLLTALIAFCAVYAFCQLSFNNSGKFKIVQFTDLHIKYGNPMSDVAIQCIEEVVDTEKPDLVIFTGDIIYAAPGRDGLDAAIKPLEQRGIPFAVTLGNHDDEQDLSRSEVYAHARSFKNCIQKDDENYVIEIAGKNNKISAIIYCMDSHAYTLLEGVGKYGWHSREQVNWYADTSARYTAANGGTPLMALAFFHIPLPEYQYASVIDGHPLIGTRREKVTCPVLNSGLYTAMRECGDVAGIFAGHDHNNDYTTIWHGILLAYGRFSGGNTVYNHLSNGARVIEITEGSREITTWLRLRGGALIDRTYFPKSYETDKWRERTEPLAPDPLN